MIKLRLIEPVTPALLPESWLRMLRALLPPDIELDAEAIRDGPLSVETAADEDRALPGTLEAVRKAEREGCHAVVIACVGDVAVQEARQESTIAVIGPGEAAMQLAGTWGGRFSIIVANEVGEQGMRDLCKRHGMEAHLASVRWLGVPIVDMVRDEQVVAAALAREAARAIQQDGADTIIIGCTLASSAERDLIDSLTALELSARVIDPLRWSVSYAYAAAVQAVGLKEQAQ